MLDDQQIKKMEQWTMVMNLMGFDAEALDPGSEEYDHEDRNLYENIELVVKLQHRMQQPDDVMSAVLKTIEMDVDTTEIYDYACYLEELEDQARINELKLLEDTNPELVKLIDKHKFSHEPNRRWPTHTCFVFTTTNGIPVQGRLFKPTWGSVRVWLNWKDSTGKRQRHRWDAKNSDFRIPKEFPKNWQDWQGYTSDSIRQAKIVAWLMVTKRHRLTGFPAIK